MHYVLRVSWRHRHGRRETTSLIVVEACASPKKAWIAWRYHSDKAAETGGRREEVVIADELFVKWAGLHPG